MTTETTYDFSDLTAEELKAKIVDRLFDMAAGVRGIPDWLRPAEAELARREKEQS